MAVVVCDTDRAITDYAAPKNIGLILLFTLLVPAKSSETQVNINP